MKSDYSQRHLEVEPLRKDSLLEDTMHLKDLDGASQDFEIKASE
jgi:hypothetical protein